MGIFNNKHNYPNDEHFRFQCYVFTASPIIFNLGRSFSVDLQVKILKAIRQTPY